MPQNQKPSTADYVFVGAVDGLIRETGSQVNDIVRGREVEGSQTGRQIFGFVEGAFRGLAAAAESQNNK